MSTHLNVGRREFLKKIPQLLAGCVHVLGEEAAKTLGGLSDSARHTISSQKNRRVPLVDDKRCSAWEGESCQLCYWVCPLKNRALILKNERPVVNTSLCDGCAKCATACQTTRSAIQMVTLDSTRY